MSDALHSIIGSESDIEWWQMCIRAALVFVYLLVLVRVADKRVFGKATSFDIVLGILLGSVLSRAVTASAPFLPTLAASAVLVALHGLLANLTFHSKRLGSLIKGRETLLVKNGELLRDAMRQTNITERDLEEAMRKAGAEDVGQVEAAYMERSGDISVITR